MAKIRQTYQEKAWSLNDIHKSQSSLSPTDPNKPHNQVCSYRSCANCSYRIHSVVKKNGEAYTYLQAIALFTLDLSMMVVDWEISPSARFAQQILPEKGQQLKDWVGGRDAQGIFLSLIRLPSAK